MLEDENSTAPHEANEADETKPVVKRTPSKTTAKRAPRKTAAAKAAESGEAAEAAAETTDHAVEEAPAPRKRAARRTTKKAAAPSVEAPPEPTAESEAAEAPEAAIAPVKKTTRKRTTKKAAPAQTAPDTTDTSAESAPEQSSEASQEPEAGAGPAVLFQAPVVTSAPGKRTRKKAAPAQEASDEPAQTQDTDDAASQAPDDTPEEAPAAAGSDASEAPEPDASGSGESGTGDSDTGDSDTGDSDTGDSDSEDSDSEDSDSEDSEGTPARRRRRRGGRRRRKSSDTASGEDATDDADADSDAESEDADSTADSSSEQSEGSSSRRRRRRRRAGEDNGNDGDDDPNTVTRVRKGRSAEDQITAVTGSTRLEAKKQRRREGREAGRRRAPIVSEAEFLARRESVERVMVIRQREELTQIAVLEDKVLVEHYVARESQTSLIGNVYLGRVQNVLPSMEAAFIDIGKGRNAVLYAGEVNWSALGHKEGTPRKIESVLQSGQMVLVQVTKDPVGHKGARLTSQISLAGRFLVYVPDGTTSGISRKLPDTERQRLKALLKEIVPDSAGVIVRTAAEGASEEELTRDVERLKARWEDIEKKSAHKGSGVQLLYGEPDLTLKVVRDLFTEDFTKLVIEGPDAWETVQGYVSHVAPDLEERLEKFEADDSGRDVFATYRIEEQIHKGLDRKVWLPSGGSLVIDRTEAMTVVDVNTGKFTGSGGNLEETVTKNNLEAAEEIVRQLRLRDIGGIIVVDFIDMVLESNRDLVVRRLVECLGRDRTRHQVAEVTSLGLVQMTRKRIGTGLLEAFSENCEHCHGRGVVVKDAPVEPSKGDDEGGRRGGNSRRNRGRRGSSGGNGNGSGNAAEATEAPAPPTPADVAAMARPEKAGGERDEPAVESNAAVETDAVVEDQAAPEAPAVEVPTESMVAPESPSEPDPSEPVPSEEGASESAPGTPQEAAAEPSVVTRTRRKSASRPAGPPPASEPAEDAVAKGDEAEGSGQPAGAEPASHEVAETPEAPEIVVTHVPIKKRGARKR